MSGISIQNMNGVQPYNVQFQGQPYPESAVSHKSNAGVLGGLVLSVPAAIDFLPDLRLRNKDIFEKSMREYSKDIIKEHSDLSLLLQDGELPQGYRNILKHLKDSIPDTESYRALCQKRTKIAIPAALTAILCTIGCGAIIDAVRNNKNKKITQEISSAKSPAEILGNPDVAINDEGVPYHKSNTGKRLAPIMGAICGAVSAYLNDGLVKKPMHIGCRAAAFALGGLVAGTIYDGVVDKKEKKVVNYLA